MKVSNASRQKLLGVALLLTLAATLYFWSNDRRAADDTAVVVTAIDTIPKTTTQNSGTAVNIQAENPQNRVLQEVTKNIFQVWHKEPESVQKTAVAQTQVPLPAPVPTPAPVAPPTAPALPFTYIGKLGEDSKYTVFLTMHGKNFAVKTGDVINQIYRIEEIKPPMLTMTYLPMNIKQIMQIGEAN